MFIFKIYFVSASLRSNVWLHIGGWIKEEEKVIVKLEVLVEMGL